MRASNARPYSVVISADKGCTTIVRGSYGFVGSFDTGPPQKMYSYYLKANRPYGNREYILFAAGVQGKRRNFDKTLLMFNRLCNKISKYINANADNWRKGCKKQQEP